MTLIVAFESSDGLVFAADSQASSGIVRRHSQKLWPLEDKGIVHAAYGKEDLIAEWNWRLNAAELPEERSIEGFAQFFAEIMEGTIRRERRNLLGPDPYSDISVAVIAGAVTTSGPVLFHVTPPGKVLARRKFETGGWGAEFAHHSVTVHTKFFPDPLDLSLRQARLLAFRILQDAIRVSGGDRALDGPVQISSLSETDGTFRAEPVTYDDADLLAAVESWRDAEHELFRTI